VLPFLEDGTLYDVLDFRTADANWYIDCDHHHVFQQRIELFLCPSDPQDEPIAWGTNICPDGKAKWDFYMTNIGGVADTRMAWTDDGRWECPIAIGDGALVNRKEYRVKDYLDGTSKTLFLGEITGGAPESKEGYTWVQFNLFDTSQGINGPNTIPGEGTFIPFLADGKKSFSGYHPDGCHFAFVDGSAHFLAQDIDAAALRSLTTRRGVSRDDKTDVFVDSEAY